MNFDSSRVRALCFDVDGTLSDTDDLWIHQFCKILSPLSFLFKDKNIQPFARRTLMSLETPANLMYNLLDRLDLDDDVARLLNYMAQHKKDKNPKKFWIIPDVQDIVINLADKYPLSVVSARGENGTLTFLKQYQLNEKFQAVVTAQTCRYTKPFPDPIIWAAKQMNVSPEECVMIGDTPVDMKAGKAAGAQTIGVLCGFGTEKELLRAGADIIIPSTANLMDVLT